MIVTVFNKDFDRLVDDMQCQGGMYRIGVRTFRSLYVGKYFFIAVER